MVGLNPRVQSIQRAFPVSPKGLVFNIQRFSLHDGPGIRTTLFFKGCPLRCAWCQNPESIKPRAEMAFVAQRCSGCFQCADACYENAIIRSEAVRIDYDQCTACGRCANACANESLILFGRQWSTAALAEAARRDQDFFDESGGGLTLSGGEPLQQWRFLSTFLPVIKAAGIHVTVQTCGCFKWPQMEALLPYLDLVYYDLKHMDPDLHRHFTGSDNGTILDNFIRLSEQFTAVVPRMPLVPDINTTHDNIGATAHFLREQGHHTIHLLPYHGLGSRKYQWLNNPHHPLKVATPEPDKNQAVAAHFMKEGIDALLYD
jgi:pyruvate formate lyase activating enzyme